LWKDIPLIKPQAEDNGAIAASPEEQPKRKQKPPVPKKTGRSKSPLLQGGTFKELGECPKASVTYTVQF